MAGRGQRTVLVVETRAGGSALIAAAERELAKGPCRFVVLAPQFGNRGQVTGDPALTRMYQSFRPGLLGPSVDQIERPVRRRLEADMSALRALGAPVDGGIVSAPLMTSIRRFVRDGVGTVIVTEPRKWFGVHTWALRIKVRIRVEVISI